MNYIALTPDVFLNEDGYPSIEYLSQYCQQPTTNKFIYRGDIEGADYKKLVFPNIVKANTVNTNDIVTQFPDLEECHIISIYNKQVILDIGSIKSADHFYMYLLSINRHEYIPFVRKNVKIIDKNTLFINGKELNVDGSWRIGPITSGDYIPNGF